MTDWEDRRVKLVTGGRWLNINMPGAKLGSIPLLRKNSFPSLSWMMLMAAGGRAGGVREEGR